MIQSYHRDPSEDNSGFYEDLLFLTTHLSRNPSLETPIHRDTIFNDF